MKTKQKSKRIPRSNSCCKQKNTVSPPFKCSFTLDGTVFTVLVYKYLSYGTHEIFLLTHLWIEWRYPSPPPPPALPLFPLQPNCGNQKSELEQFQMVLFSYLTSNTEIQHDAAKQNYINISDKIASVLFARANGPKHGEKQSWYTCMLHITHYKGNISTLMTIQEQVLKMMPLSIQTVHDRQTGILFLEAANVRPLYAV